MTQDAKPLGAADLLDLRALVSLHEESCGACMNGADAEGIPCYASRLLATIDQQAEEASASSSDETPTIAYWRRNAHEAIDRMIEAQVTARLSGDSEAAAYLQAHNEAMFLAQQVVNHVTNARLAEAAKEPK